MKQPNFPKLRGVEAVQVYLDGVAYSSESRYRSPRSVVRDRRAHCVDGAFFAAHALRALGHRPLLVDLRAVRDDDHVVAVFRERGRWGAVAKSNVVGLRFREPVYRTVRELVMSYFEVYYNTDAERTLRSYTSPFDLTRYDRVRWHEDDDALDAIVVALDERRHHELLTKPMVRALHRVDERSYRAGLLGVDPAGLYGADKLRVDPAAR